MNIAAEFPSTDEVCPTANHGIVTKGTLRVDVRKRVGRQRSIPAT